MILIIISLSAAVVGAYGPMLSPGFVEVSQNLNITIEILSQATAWLILTIGLGLFLTNPLAKIIGRRPVFLLAIIIMFVTSVWGAAVSEYNSFLGSRIVAGVGMAPYEVLVQCTIGDLYFVHERATRIAVWNLFLLTGISGGALVAGYIIELDGYQWTFGVCAIFFGVLMIAIVFFVPETVYRRNSLVIVPSPDNKGSEKPHMELAHEHDVKYPEDKGTDDKGTAVPTAADTPALERGSGPLHYIFVGRADEDPMQKHSFFRSLRVFTGRHTHAKLWKVFVRPVILLFYPAVFWAFLLYGKQTLVSYLLVLHEI
jgi:MFS family permease